MLLKIGELAKRTGLTVRTLHHYDAIKLLCPSARSSAGYRLYDRRDIERLHRIQALRRLDLSLAEIASLLEGDSTDLQTVIEQQIALLDRQAARTVELRDRLKRLLTNLAENLEPDLPDWLVTLEMMAMYDKYFTSGDLATMHALAERLDKNILSHSKTLIASIRDLMDRNIPAESEEAQALSKPWMALVHARMGGDIRLIRKLDSMHRNEPVAQVMTGVDGVMIDYMTQAFLAFRLKIYAKYLSDDEMQVMRTEFGAHRLQWIELFADVREQMELDPSPLHPAAQTLCGRWSALDRATWGPDPVVHEKVRVAHDNEPDLLVGTGIDEEMRLFIRQGVTHLIELQTSKTGTSHERQKNG